MLHTLTFDIETIPQGNSELSVTQKEEIERKVMKALDKEPKADPIALKNKIMGTSPYFGKIICLGVHLSSDFNQEGESDVLIGSEEKILKDFWNIVKNRNILYVSYNGLSFDVPFIIKRAMRFNMKPSDRNFLKTRRYASSPHYDVKEVISDWDRFAAPTLKLACDLVGIPSPKEGEVKAEGVYEAFLAGEIDKIAAYCERDVVATYKLYQAIKPFSTW